MSTLAAAIRDAWCVPKLKPREQVVRTVVSTEKPFVIPKMPNTSPPAFSLQSMLDRFLYKWDDSIKREVVVQFGGPRKQFCFHPSEIAKEDACDRALAYELLGAPKTQRVIESRLQRIFQNGHFVHARLQYVIALAVAELGGYSKAEVKWTRTDDGIEGSCDMIIVLPIQGTMWAYAIEIKSMKLSMYTNLGAEPWPEHRAQLNTYMYKHGVFAGFVFIECKDNQNTREYFLRFSATVMQNTLDRANRIRAAAAAKILPPQTGSEDGCGAEECSFWQICKGPRKGEWQP